MKLSMWILADWLKKYRPIVKIISGKQILRNVRYLTETNTMSSLNVYIGCTKDFIPSTVDGIICVNEQDMILLQTDDAQEIFNEILAAFDFYNEWDDSLHDMIQGSCTLQDILDSSQKAFNCPLVICDSAHMVLAHNADCPYPDTYAPILRSIEEEHFLPLETISIINQEIQGQQNTREPYLHCSAVLPTPSLQRNLFYGRTHIGWLIMEASRGTIAPGIFHILDTLGKAVEYWYELSEAQRELASQADIFLELLSENPAPFPTLARRLQAIGWQPEDHKLLIKILSDTTDGRIYFSLQKILPQTFSGCYAFLYEGSVVLAANLRLYPEQELWQVLTGLLLKSKTYCGVSYPFTNIMNLKQAYGQADIALTYGKRETGRIHHCSDYVLPYARDILSKNLTTDIRHQILGQLREYDRQNQTDYYETLFQYLVFERNQVLTARKMCLHRNTLVYRINRITELFPMDLDNPATRWHLLLSYFIEKEHS